MKKGYRGRVLTFGITTALLLTACGGRDGGTTNSEAPGNVEVELTDTRIAEILPKFDLEGIELKSTQKGFVSEQTDETIPLIINYQGVITSDTPRQCLGGSNPISRSFEKTLLDNGWTIDSLLTGDYSATLASSSSMRIHEVFRKSDYVVTISCGLQVSDAEEQTIEGSWGSTTIKRSCIVNNGPEAQIILSFKAVPKIIMGMASQNLNWTKTSLGEVDPIFLDDAWRLFATRENAYPEPITDFEGIPYSYRGEYPKTPNDTNHGPIRACRFDEQSSKWIIPS